MNVCTISIVVIYELIFFFIAGKIMWGKQIQNLFRRNWPYLIGKKSLLLVIALYIDNETMKAEKADQIIPEIAMRGASMADIKATMAEHTSNEDEITHQEHQINLKVSIAFQFAYNKLL